MLLASAMKNEATTHLQNEMNTGSAGLRILLVEDHEDTAATTALVLRLYGHEVQVATDGPGALLAAQAEPPDVVLLDIGLPGMDGYEVAEKLRQERRARRPLLIALTGRGQKEECLRSYRAGIDLHLTKPASGEEVQRFLEHYQRVTTPV